VVPPALRLCQQPQLTRVYHPERALVADDNPPAIGWAKAAGTRTARGGAYEGGWPELDL